MKILNLIGIPTRITYLCGHDTYTVSCIDSIPLRDRYHNIYYLREGNLLNAAVVIEGYGNVWGAFSGFSYSSREILYEFNYQGNTINIEFPPMANCW